MKYFYIPEKNTKLFKQYIEEKIGYTLPINDNIGISSLFKLCILDIIRDNSDTIFDLNDKDLYIYPLGLYKQNQYFYMYHFLIKSKNPDNDSNEHLYNIYFAPYGIEIISEDILKDPNSQFISCDLVKIKSDSGLHDKKIFNILKDKCIYLDNPEECPKYKKRCNECQKRLFSK